MKRINRDNIPHLVNCSLIVISKSWFGIIAKIYAKWWGITIGRKNIFNGLPCFRRHPQSHIKIGSGCTFNSSPCSNLIGVNKPCIIATLANQANIIIGDNCGFSGTTIGSAKQIILKNNVRCGANTLITDTDWHWKDPRSGPDSPVIIEDNVWLGVNVTVLKGVTIGKNTLVGANSTVTRSLPDNVIAFGTPAKVSHRI